MKGIRQRNKLNATTQWGKGGVKEPKKGGNVWENGGNNLDRSKKIEKDYEVKTKGRENTKGFV